MTKKTEVLEVLTDDQLKKLPAKIKNNVIYLQKELRPQDLKDIVELSLSLIDLNNNIKAIKFKGKDDDGNFDKENCREYQDLKNATRSFNTKIGKLMKAVKKPYDDMLKKVREFEKLLKEANGKNQELLFKEFKEWIDHQENEKELKRLAKEKKHLDTIEDLSDDNKQMSNTIEIYKHKEEIKKYTSSILANAQECVLKYSGEALLGAIEELESLKIPYSQEALNVLSKEDIQTLESDFAVTINSAIQLYKNKIDESNKPKEVVNTLEPLVPQNEIDQISVDFDETALEQKTFGRSLLDELDLVIERIRYLQAIGENQINIQDRVLFGLKSFRFKVQTQLTEQGIE